MTFHLEQHSQRQKTRRFPSSLLRVSHWPLRVKLFAVSGSVLALVMLGLFSGVRLSTRLKEAAYEVEKEATEDVALVAKLQRNLTQLVLQKESLLESELSNNAFRKKFGQLIFEYQQFKENWARLLASEEFDTEESSEVTEPEREIAVGIVRDHRLPVEDYTRRFDALLLRDSTSKATRAELKIELQALEESSFIARVNTFVDDISALSRATDEEFAEARQLQEEASRRQMQIIALSLLLSGGAGLIMTVALSEILTRPLSQIATIAEQSIQQENFNLQAPVKTGDEVGHLAQTFNAYMAFVRDLLHDRAATNARLSDLID
ncbi:MAG: HAMP domain-containing protein [Geitlerinemataceae cyanobacterium]